MNQSRIAFAALTIWAYSSIYGGISVYSQDDPVPQNKSISPTAFAEALTLGPGNWPGNPTLGPGNPTLGPGKPIKLASEDSSDILIPAHSTWPDAADPTPQSLREMVLAAAEEELPVPAAEKASIAEQLSRDRSTTANVMRLRKPIADVVIQATEAGREVPADRAARYLPDEPLILITALDVGPPLPDRYAVGFKHRPLYFEQPRLERCGRGCNYLQNAISGAQFLANTILLPYHM